MRRLRVEEGEGLGLTCTQPVRGDVRCGGLSWRGECECFRLVMILTGFEHRKEDGGELVRRGRDSRPAGFDRSSGRKQNRIRAHRHSTNCATSRDNPAANGKLFYISRQQTVDSGVEDVTDSLSDFQKVAQNHRKC
jgi:hypothetical protein